MLRYLKLLQEVWGETVITFLKLSILQSNGWDPDEMFKYNEETYGVKSTYDSSLSSYTQVLSFVL